MMWWELIVGLVLVGLAAIVLSASARGEDGRPLVHLHEVGRDVGIALLTGAVIAGVIYYSEQRREDERSLQALRVANLIFVRSALADPDGTRRFDGLDLAGVRLDGLSGPNAAFGGSNLRGASLLRVDLTSAEFYETDLRDAKIGAARIVASSFLNARMSGAAMVSVDLTNTEMQNVDLDNVTFQQVNLSGTIFLMSQLHNVTFTKVCWADGQEPVFLLPRPETFTKPERTGVPDDKGNCPF